MMAGIFKCDDDDFATMSDFPLRRNNPNDKSPSRNDETKYGGYVAGGKTKETLN
jgi:hypothetical protein